MTRIAQNNGGFVLSSQIRGQRRGTLVLRIPAKRFDDAMLALRGIGVVQAQSITGKDVTAQYIDLKRAAAERDRSADRAPQPDGAGHDDPGDDHACRTA